MRTLAGELLLTAWEQGASQHDLHRAVTMLSIALPADDRGALESVSIAERNLLLLRLHELTFGPLLNIFAVCPKCAEPLEFSIPTAAMTEQLQRTPATSIEWSQEGRQYRLRSVTTEDLLASLQTADTTAAQECVLSRCVDVSPRPETESLSTSADVMEKFEQLHASVEFSCAVDCPACSGHDVLDLDIARFLWAEVRSAARRLLGEIHTLASAYGWSEQAIIEMTPRRRAAYLEILNA
jgi:hypothetical protein